MNKDTFLLGVIVKAQGIKGEVKVKPYTDTPDVLCRIKSVIINNEPMYIDKARCDRTMAYIKLKGIEDRDQAEAMKGLELSVDKKEAPALPEGRYYVDDLIGCTALDDEGAEIGKLIDVIQNSANDVYVIKNEKGEILIPALKSVIKSVDIQKKEVVFVKERLSEVALYEY
ncbi:MAG: 16S rRNA processing protein RimM [Clostridia bacterium]|nr:16S rRNA processing protein RimM [Clostridia bacterium]